MSDTTMAYRESFGCHLEGEEDHDHPGDCQWGFACGICGRNVDGEPCPEHAPHDIPGLTLADCDAVPRHPRTWFLASDSDGPPCMYCSYAALAARHDGCEHSHHGAWRRWKVTHWLAGRGYSLGVVRGFSTSWGGGCDYCLSYFRWGRSGYVLGKRREWWFCLLRRRHLFRPVPGIDWLCDRCSPDPETNQPQGR